MSGAWLVYERAKGGKKRGESGWNNRSPRAAVSAAVKMSPLFSWVAKVGGNKKRILIFLPMPLNVISTVRGEFYHVLSCNRSCLLWASTCSLYQFEYLKLCTHKILVSILSRMVAAAVEKADWLVCLL